MSILNISKRWQLYHCFSEAAEIRLFGTGQSLTSDSDASSPNVVLPSGMKHSGNDHEPLCFNYFVNNPLGKSFWIAPTDVLCWMSEAVQERIDCKDIEYCQYLFGEFISKTDTLSVIPLCCFKDVGYHLRTRNDFPVHDFDRDRKRFLSSSNGTEELGSA